jgi:SpoVK/Ycf46/Vps4 family AAA+-type ATPase
MNKVIDFSEFTNWAKDIYNAYTSKVCNTFVITGNIGDYAFAYENLIEYIKFLLSDECSFAFDSMITYDTAMGGRYVFGNTGTGNSKLSFSDICDKIENSSNTAKNAYVIQYPQSAIPNCSFERMSGNQETNCIRLHRALNSTNYFRQSSLVIIIAESVNDVNPMFLSSNIKSMNINISLPDEKSRFDFLNLCIRSKNERGGGFYSNIDLGELVRLTAGLTYMSIEDIILQSGKNNPITKKNVLDKKAELIRKEYSDIVELLDASDLSLEDFAGQNEVKAYFKDVVIDAIANGNDKIVPKGVLLMGPPGTGKSFFARCLAGSAGINFVEFKMSKILDKYVGEAEKNLEKAFAVFKALAPVGVFIDELDQALSRGENDSNSVNKNLFGMFLAELSNPNNRGKIIWLGATNYPNKIDEALKRTGRFDKKIPFFAPTLEERKLVFKKRIEKATNNNIDGQINYIFLASQTEGFTQAEIEGIVVKGLELARRRGSDKISNNDLTRALDYMTSTQNSRITEMEDIALLECNDVEFLSANYRNRKKALENK